MKKFLAVYTMQPDAWKSTDWGRMSEAEREKRKQEGMAAWQQWMARHKSAIIDDGGPLGKTKCAARGGVSDTRNNIAGYIIVQADSHEAAAQMFANHPHYMLFPGEGVEIMECLPMPT